MMSAKVVLAGGLLLVLAGFGFGTQPGSTSVDHLVYSCDAAIPAGWLVSGTLSGDTSRPDSLTAEERRAAAGCARAVDRNRAVVWTMLGVGGLLALTGATAFRERRHPRDPELIAAHQ
jgi:hypothetical protein